MSIKHSKEDLRNFWTKLWFYHKTPNDWVSKLNGDHFDDGRSFVSKTTSAKYHKVILLMAIDKLVYDKQIAEKEADSLKKMIESSDREDHYMAITIMALKKPKKFKNVQEWNDKEQV